jgi:AcrR family transcriptional regulator
VPADDRRQRRRTALLEAGLDCLGSEDADISVRRVCAAAGLTQRYFYESFANLDELQVALFNQIAADVAVEGAAALEAHSSADLDEACRIVFSGAYSVFRRDPRKARAALAVAAGTVGLTEARRAIVLSYADTLLAFLGSEFGEPADTSRARIAALYAVGGMLEITHAVLNGDVALTDDELAEIAGGLLASSVRQLAAPTSTASPA